MKTLWLGCGTALALLLQGIPPSFATYQTRDEDDTTLSSHSLPLSSNNNSIRGQDVHSREGLWGNESSSLEAQQKDLRKAILSGTHAVVDQISFIKERLLQTKSQLSSLVSPLKQPFELIDRKGPSLSSSQGSQGLDFERLEKLVSRLEEERQKLSPLDPAINLVQSLMQIYQGYQKAVMEADTPNEREALLTPKVRLTGDHLGTYLIPQSMAQQLSWRDLYGFQSIKTNAYGNHRVLGKGGAHFKLSSAAHTLEGGINELQPGMEYALSSFYQLMDERIASPSTLLALQDQTFRQLPPSHPFTKGLQLLLLEGQMDAETFLHQNIGVKDALERAGIITYKESRFLQASLTAGDISLDEFLMQAHQNPSLYEKVDRSSFSALIMASLLTNPSDGKFDNYRVKLTKERDGTITSALFIAIDNDEGMIPSVLPLQNGGHIVGIKAGLFFLDSLMNESVDGKFRESFLKKSPEGLLLEWIDTLREQNQRYTHLLKEGVLHERAFHHLSLPIGFKEGALLKLYEKLKTAHNLLKAHPKISHTALFKRLEPLAWHYYEALMSTSPETLLSLVAKKDESRIPVYKALFEEKLPRPAHLVTVLYGQRGLLPLSFEDLCDLNRGSGEGNNTLRTSLANVGSDERRREDDQDAREALETSWQNLARTTEVGALLLQQAKEKNDTLLAGKLLALGVGDIREILKGVASLDARITKLDLKGKKLTDLHAKELGQALKSNPYLQELILEDNQIREAGLDHLLQGITHHKKIKTLSLAKNPLSFKGIKTLKLLSHVTSLNLSQTELMDEDIFLLFQADALTSVTHLDVSKTRITGTSGEILLKYFNTLTRLNLSRTGAAEGALKAIGANQYLEALDLSHTRITDEKVNELSLALQQNKSLKHLNLYYNTITEKGADALAALMSANTMLENLNLGNNGLRDQGVAIFAAGLQKNKTLKSLNLSRNFIKGEGATALYKAIQSHPTLEEINLDYNGGIGQSALQKLQKLQEIKTRLKISLKQLYASS